MHHLTRQHLALFLLLFLIISCTNHAEKAAVTAYGPFLGMQATETPQLLAPDLLASPMVEFNGTFTPDGKTFFYTSDIPNHGIITFTEMQEDGTWASPAVAPFSGTHSEYDPIFSPDGKRLYFSSRRPTDIYENKTKSNIWWVERAGDSWSDPTLIPLADQDVYYSSLTRSGAIYFNIWSNGKLFKANPEGDGFQIDTLSDILHTQGNIGDPFVSPDEDYIIFRGYGEDSFGQGDLYISFKVNGEWTARQNLGEPINSKDLEICPYVTPDGQFFIFASSRLQVPYVAKPSQPFSELQSKFKTADNGELNIYYISTSFIDRLKANVIPQ